MLMSTDKKYDMRNPWAFKPKKALVVVDMQNDFVTGALANERAQAIVSNVVVAINQAKALGYDIIYTLDTHSPNYYGTQEGHRLPVLHCLEGTVGWKLIPEVRAMVDLEEDTIIKKPTFGSTELAKLTHKYDTVVLTGVCTDICVVSNALAIKAENLTTDVQVIRNATAGLTEETEEAAITTMKTCQVDILKDASELESIPEFVVPV